MDVEKEKMTLSIKALTPAPEGVAPRRREKREEGESAEGEEKPRRERRRDARPAQDDDEPREWTEGGVSGISLGDLINKD